MTDFIFQHGGMVGGYIWDELVEAMEARRTGDRFVKLDVPGCGTNPVATNPDVSRFWYGGQGNNIAKPEQSSAPASILPVLSRLDAAAAGAPGNNTGITLVQSPYDTPIVAFAQATPASPTNAAAGGWLKWTRQYHRLGGVGGAHEANRVTFSQDLIAHAGCWRPAVAWLQARYPAFFAPHPTAAATATAVFGAASHVLFFSLDPSIT